MGTNFGFFESTDGTGSYLAARGFNDQGDRSGGIIAPRKVEVTPGCTLFRLYRTDREEFGQWWSTGAELAKIFRSFGREGAAAAEGRTIGKGILHATLAVRHDWGRPAPDAPPSPDHLGRFVCATPIVTLTAYYGVGDDAPSESKKEVQKAMRIMGADGSQIGVRQLFFPKCWNYKDSFKVLEQGWTDTGLLTAVRRHPTATLPFE